VMETIGLAIYKDIFSCENTGIAVWDLTRDEILYDETLEKLLDAPLQREHFSQVLMNRVRVHPNDHHLLLELIAFLSRTHKEYRDGKCSMAFEYRILGADDAYHWFHLRQIIYFKGDHPYKAVGILRNTDEERRQQEELLSRAERDPMTGLYNKERVRELIEEALQVPDTENALLVLDMDGFKQVNDQLGHLAGDAVISDMALSLQTVFRRTDILGRIGGDEFVVLLRDTVGDTAFIIDRCDQLRGLLRRSFTKGKKKLHVTGSIGIAAAPRDGITYDALFARADAALYRAKELGRDTQAFYDPRLKESREERMPEGIAQGRESAFLEHPVEYIFQMLYETKDADLTVKLLLELFAKYFHVHRVYIYQMFEENYWSKCIFEWRASGITSTDEAHYGRVAEIVQQNYRQTEYGYFSECRDAEELEPADRDAMLSQNVRAFLHCGIMEGTRFLGCVGFDDVYQARIWTRKEHEVLKAFADIMGSFLLDQSSINTLLVGNRHFRLILNTMDSYIWVIQQDTHDILYMNTPAYRDFGQESSILEKCYKIFHGQEEVCEECPFSPGNETQRAFSFWNEKFQRQFTGKSFLVQWDENTAAWLVFANK